MRVAMGSYLPYFFAIIEQTYLRLASHKRSKRRYNLYRLHAVCIVFAKESISYAVNVCFC